MIIKSLTKFSFEYIAQEIAKWQVQIQDPSTLDWWREQLKMWILRYEGFIMKCKGASGQPGESNVTTCTTVNDNSVPEGSS